MGTTAAAGCGLGGRVLSTVPGAADALPPGSPDLVGVVNIHFLDSHPAHMMFQGSGFHHWISNDYGRTYEPIDTPGKTLGYGADIKIHPTKPDWVLSRVRRKECLHVRGGFPALCPESDSDLEIDLETPLSLPQD